MLTKKSVYEKLENKEMRMFEIMVAVDDMLEGRKGGEDSTEKECHGHSYCLRCISKDRSTH